METKLLRQYMNEIRQDNVPEEYKDVIEDYDTDYLNGEDSELLFTIAIELQRALPGKVYPVSVAKLLIALYEAIGQNGDSNGWLNLGAIHYSGDFGKIDYAKAVYYYTKAAALGNEVATENLGYCYYYGRSVPVDYEKAFQCFAKGAALGRLNSIYKLADLYSIGKYVAKDVATAGKLYRKCYRDLKKEFKEHDYKDRDIAADICGRQGDTYFYGKGVEVDYYKALKYYQKAEYYFYEKIKNGDHYASKGLKYVLEKQSEARAKIEAKLR